MAMYVYTLKTCRVDLKQLKLYI